MRPTKNHNKECQAQTLPNPLYYVYSIFLNLITKGSVSRLQHFSLTIVRLQWILKN